MRRLESFGLVRAGAQATVDSSPPPSPRQGMLTAMDQLDFRPISESEERELHTQCIASLRSGDPRRVFDAVQALQWFPSDDQLLDVLLEMLEAPETVFRGLALEGLAALDHAGSADCLAAFVERHRRDEDEAARAVAVLGGVGSAANVAFLELVIWDPATYGEEVRERAVEALLTLATRGFEEARRLLEVANQSQELDEAITASARAALRELGKSDWGDQGFATIDATLEPND